MPKRPLHERLAIITERVPPEGAYPFETLTLGSTLVAINGTMALTWHHYVDFPSHFPLTLTLYLPSLEHFQPWLRQSMTHQHLGERLVMDIRFSHTRHCILDAYVTFGSLYCMSENHYEVVLSLMDIFFLGTAMQP